MADPIRNKDEAKRFQQGFQGGWFDQPTMYGGTSSVPSYGSTGYNASSPQGPAAPPLAPTDAEIQDQIKQRAPQTAADQKASAAKNYQSLLADAKTNGLDTSIYYSPDKFSKQPWSMQQQLLTTVQSDIDKQIKAQRTAQEKQPVYTND